MNALTSWWWLFPLAFAALVGIATDSFAWAFAALIGAAWLEGLIEELGDRIETAIKKENGEDDEFDFEEAMARETDIMEEA